MRPRLASASASAGNLVVAAGIAADLDVSVSARCDGNRRYATAIATATATGIVSCVPSGSLFCFDVRCMSQHL